MAYNLTPKQKELLKWLVSKSRSNKMANEFNIVRTQEGIVIAGPGKASFPAPDLEMTDLEVWARNDLINLITVSGAAYRCSLLQSAYDAVDNDFNQPPSPPTSVSISNDFHGATIGNYQSVGMAYNSQISQTVNDPEVFIEGITAACSKLLEIVEKELNTQDRLAYIEALNLLRSEVRSKEPDRSKIRNLIGILSLTADIFATYELMAKVLPMVQAILMLLAAHSGG